ncbi:hypothetical protein [Aquimarina sp. RZ0]|uniref:hypothetical protein n=1 Tax=Aquimarina sp. RZ0 TaxID=2607730 RepID=UPI0011F1BA88|nr:hypothetical protein [Aquimarina sp. RZ0]KAA1244593.1 hypothetical protein F0000_15840 [Aquimarina sp. RZ0]
MLKNILNFDGIQKLNKEQQIFIHGSLQYSCGTGRNCASAANYTIYCNIYRNKCIYTPIEKTGSVL